MTTNTNRKLAKGFWPVLLLSAALSLPAASVAAPSAHGKAHAADRHNDKREQRQQKQAVQQQQREVRQQRQVERQVRQLRKVQRQMSSREQRAWAEQQAKARRQALRSRDHRAPANKAQKVQKVAVVPQRRAVVQQRPVVVERPVYVAQRNNRNRSWDGWNRRYNKYGSGAFQLDGTFVDQQYGCVLVRDHQGQVIPLVGNPGDLRRGEHLLLSGRIQNNTSCGTAFRVDSVDRVWADAGHRRVLFDRRYDGEYYDQSGGRYGRYDDRYDRYSRDRYDDRYDRDGDYDRDGRRTISVDGRLDDSGDCPVIRGDRGEYYDLVGDLRNFRDGKHVRVIGRDGIRSECGGPAIEVGEIINR